MFPDYEKLAQTLAFASERATAGPTTQGFGRDFKTDTVFPGIILTKISRKYGFKSKLQV